MKDNFAWLRPKQAGELAGYTARHIQNLITKGKLSATKEDGNYYIDREEFYRVFPNACRKDQLGNVDQLLAEKEQLAFENTLLKDVVSDKDKENEFLRKENEFLRNNIDMSTLEKSKILDAMAVTTRLLEYKIDNR